MRAGARRAVARRAPRAPGSVGPAAAAHDPDREPARGGGEL